MNDNKNKNIYTLKTRTFDRLTLIIRFGSLPNELARR